MTENEYQRKLIRKLREQFPGCVIIKNDSGYQQGFPDLTIFFGERWATLEVKMEADAKEQPNQDYFVQRLNEMSFSAFIYPENEAEVLVALQQALAVPGSARIPQS
jgi:hypothetical protein